MVFPLLISAPIQLTHRVATVEAVVRELGEKTGRSLKIKSELADEVLYVALKPHSEPDLMALVAKAASAEWIEDGGMFLGRSNSFRRKLEKEEHGRLAADIEAARKDTLDPNDSSNWDAGTDHLAKLIEARRATGGDLTYKQLLASEAKLRTTLPMGRFLSRILRGISSEEIAAIPIGTTVRYVERPNSRQRAFPGTAQTARYFEERRMIANNLLSLPPAQQKEAGNISYLMDPKAQGNLTPFVLVERGWPDRVNLLARTVDANGRSVDFTSCSLFFRSFATAESLPGYKEWRNKTLTVTGSAKVFANPTPADPTESQRPEIYRQIVKSGTEPLALIMTEPMDALVATLESEAIVALPDALANESCSRMRGTPTTLGGFADGLVQYLSFEQDGKVLVGHALAPLEDSALKTNRAAFRTFMQSVSTGFPSLDTFARYATTQKPEVCITWFELAVLGGAGLDRLGNSSSNLYDVDSGSRELLVIYANLSPAQRTTLRKGGSIPATQLSPAARQLFESILYRRAVEVEGERPSNAAIDPTLLGDNLLTHAVLGVSRMRSDSVVGLRNQQGIQTYDFPTLGFVLGEQEGGKFLDPTLGYPNVKATKFSPGVEDTFYLSLRVSDKYAFNGPLQDLQISPTAKPVAYDDLPAASKAEAQKSYERYRKMKKP